MHVRFKKIKVSVFSAIVLLYSAGFSTTYVDGAFEDNLFPVEDRKPGPGELHRTAVIGGVQGSSGTPFIIPIDGKLVAIQVALGTKPLEVIVGLKFKTLTESGELKTIMVGTLDGNWNPWFELPKESRVVGFSANSGWFIDNIQFILDTNETSPRYGGPGGDTSVKLTLNQKNSSYGGKIRAFYGTSSESGIETLGFYFDPAD